MSFIKLNELYIWEIWEIILTDEFAAIHFNEVF